MRICRLSDEAWWNAFAHNAVVLCPKVCYRLALEDDEEEVVCAEEADDGHDDINSEGLRFVYADS